MRTINLLLDHQFHEFITDYIDGKLDKTELLVFEEYLDQAEAECVFVQAVRGGKQVLAQLPPVKAADDFEEKLAQRIAGEQEHTPVEEAYQEEQV